MTSASRVIGLVVVAALAVTTLAGCATAVGEAPRSVPNDAELTAVIRASGSPGVDGRLEFGAPWVQLWTGRQLARAIEPCLQSGASVDECYAAHPVDLRVFAMSEPQRIELYGYYQTVLDRCLSSRGYRVGRVPDRDRFLSEVRDGDPWSPYDVVVVSTRSEWYALSDACPPVPSALDLALGPN